MIPLVRGASRSRSAEAVVGEVRRRVGQGHREVVLTGINLGCYRDRAAGCSLAGLVRAVGEVPGLARLRLSSLEVNHLNGELVTALRETPPVARHLHVAPRRLPCYMDLLRSRAGDDATINRRVLWVIHF